MPEWEVIDAPEVGYLADRPSPLVLSQLGAAIRGKPEDYAADFARHRALAFSDLLDADFVRKIQAVCDRAQFVPESTAHGENRSREAPSLAGGAISLALRHSGCLRWTEQATQCGPLGLAYGRIMRVPADGQSYLWWHDDLGSDPARRIGVTIYLGGPDYEGGLFELREKTGKLLVRHRHVRVGSALLFDVAPDVEHRLSPLTSGGPRLVFVGWMTKAA